MPRPMFTRKGDWVVFGWMLFMHLVDIYWLVMPKVPEAVHEADSYRVLAQQVGANMALGRGNPGFEHNRRAALANFIHVQLSPADIDEPSRRRMESHPQSETASSPGTMGRVRGSRPSRET